jgi:hypothetical protein
MLSGDTRVDPSANRNEAVREASKNGHVKVVNVLFSDKRVYPSANNNYAIMGAIRNGHHEVLKLLYVYPYAVTVQNIKIQKLIFLFL